MSEASPQHGSGEDGARRRRQRRVRNPTAQDRARHRDFEKGRREAFNRSLMELASLLPSLEDAREGQLSKHLIVEESVKHHRSQRALVEQLVLDMDRQRAENDRLTAELNASRLSRPAQHSRKLPPSVSTTGSTNPEAQHPMALHTDQSQSSTVWDAAVEPHVGDAYSTAMVGNSHHRPAHDFGEPPLHVPSSRLSMDVAISSVHNKGDRLISHDAEDDDPTTPVNDTGRSDPGYSMWSYPII